jgi:putative membrane protein
MLGGCSTSRKQPADASAAAAQPSAQPTAQQAAAKPPAVVPPPEVSSKKTNAAILERIHLANLKEIAAAKIAESKASSSEVREYADQLIKDHTSADQMVVATAQKMGARLRDPAADRRKTANAKRAEQKLSSANGAQFDRVFLEQTSADHKKLMTELKQARDDASDDDIEALIDKIMPILQQHQDLAEILMKKEQA